MKNFIDNLAIKWAWAVENIFHGRYSRALVVPPINGILKAFKIKPGLAHIEIHLVDHCNLNCRGCDHLSPIADKWLANPEIFDKDLQQLKKLFSGIQTITLLGGEPLLHPQVERFLHITREHFPWSTLILMTNGLLLDGMPKTFWESCRTTSTVIFFDVYPPLYDKEEYLLQFVKSKGVSIISSKVNTFQACLNLKGDSNPDAAFKKCSYRSIHQLKEGKIYPCIIPMVVQYFNKRFGTSIVSAGWVDIYTPNIGGWDIIKTLEKTSFETCRYCATAKDQLANASFKWEKSNLQMNEWDSATYK